MIVRTWVRTALSALLIIVFAVCGRAQEPPEDLVLERFSVAKGGDTLILPVDVNGQKCRFVLDTGAGCTVCDRSVRLGKRQGDVEAETPDGTVKLMRYDLPETTVGRLRFVTADPVATEDLQPLREVIDAGIDGILGMDFLRHHVVRIDFDRGQILFLKSVPVGSGEVVEIFPSSRGCSQLCASIAGIAEKRFDVDTGFSGCAWLEEDSMSRNLQKNVLQGIGQTKSRTLSGEHDTRITTARRLTLGTFAVENPVLDSAKNGNGLGLAFWSRFVVTFDFPAQKLYLRKGKEYARAEKPDVAGLHLLRKGEAVVVHSVDEESSAAIAGIRAGDQLVQVGALRSDETTLFQLRVALRKAGKLSCTIRRDNSDRRVNLTVPGQK